MRNQQTFNLNYLGPIIFLLSACNPGLAMVIVSVDADSLFRLTDMCPLGSDIFQQVLFVAFRLLIMSMCVAESTRTFSFMIVACVTTFYLLVNEFKLNMKYHSKELAIIHFRVKKIFSIIKATIICCVSIFSASSFLCLRSGCYIPDYYRRSDRSEILIQEIFYLLITTILIFLYNSVNLKIILYYFYFNDSYIKCSVSRRTHFLTRSNQNPKIIYEIISKIFVIFKLVHC